jgi:hypothetical protein
MLGFKQATAVLFPVHKQESTFKYVCFGDLCIYLEMNLTHVCTLFAVITFATGARGSVVG